MIGVSIKGIGKIGVIHSVFDEENPKKGTTRFGTLEHGIFQLDFDPKEIIEARNSTYLEPQFELEGVSEDIKIRVVASLFWFSA